MKWTDEQRFFLEAMVLGFEATGGEYGMDILFTDKEKFYIDNIMQKEGYGTWKEAFDNLVNEKYPRFKDFVTNILGLNYYAEEIE